MGSRGNVFRQEGEYWTIIYEGILFRLRDAKGLRYLAHLLRHPDNRIHCRDLLMIAGTHCSDTSATDERIRLAVTKRIKASVARIALLHPALADHLSIRLKTGYFCVYVADPHRQAAWKA